MRNAAEGVLVFRHEMPRSWHILSPLGSALCLIGAAIGGPYISLPGLAITLPCSIWYVVRRRRMRQLAQRLQSESGLPELW